MHVAVAWRVFRVPGSPSPMPSAVPVLACVRREHRTSKHDVVEARAHQLGLTGRRLSSPSRPCVVRHAVAVANTRPRPAHLTTWEGHVVTSQASAAEYERKQNTEQAASTERSQAGKVSASRAREFTPEQAALLKQAAATAAAAQQRQQPRGGASSAAGAGAAASAASGKYTRVPGMISQVYLDPNPANPSLIVSIGGSTGRMETVRSARRLRSTAQVTLTRPPIVRCAGSCSPSAGQASVRVIGRHPAVGNVRDAEGVYDPRDCLHPLSTVLTACLGCTVDRVLRRRASD